VVQKYWWAITVCPQPKLYPEPWTSWIDVHGLLSFHSNASHIAMRILLTIALLPDQ